MKVLRKFLMLAVLVPATAGIGCGEFLGQIEQEVQKAQLQTQATSRVAAAESAVNTGLAGGGLAFSGIELAALAAGEATYSTGMTETAPCDGGGDVIFDVTGVTALGGGQTEHKLAYTASNCAYWPTTASTGGTTPTTEPTSIFEFTGSVSATIVLDGNDEPVSVQVDSQDGQYAYFRDANDADPLWAVQLSGYSVSAAIDYGAETMSLAIDGEVQGTTESTKFRGKYAGLQIDLDGYALDNTAPESIALNGTYTYAGPSGNLCIEGDYEFATTEPIVLGSGDCPSDGNFSATYEGTTVNIEYGFVGMTATNDDSGASADLDCASIESDAASCVVLSQDQAF